MEIIIISDQESRIPFVVFDELPYDPAEITALERILTRRDVVAKFILEEEMRNDGNAFDILLVALKHTPRFSGQEGLSALELWARQILSPAMPKNWTIHISVPPDNIIKTNTELGKIFCFYLIPFDRNKVKFRRVSADELLKACPHGFEPGSLAKLN